MSLLNSIEIFNTGLILVIEFCTFASGFVSDLDVNLHQLQDDINSMEKINNHLAIKKTIGLKKKLANFIHFHSDARQ